MSDILENLFKEFKEKEEANRSNDDEEDESQVEEPGFWYFFLGVSSLLATFGLIDFLFASSEPPAYLPFLIIALIFLTVYFIAGGIERRILAKKFVSYMLLLMEDQNKSLSNLAKASGTSESQVKKDLKEIIRNGISSDIAINENSGVIVIRSNLDVGKNIVSEKTSKEHSKHASSKRKVYTIKCEGCGAVNKVPEGATLCCEYCGTHIAK